MKKHYVLAAVNTTTGEIEHMAVSDLPLGDEMLPSSKGANAPSVEIQRFTFENTDGGFLKARQVMDSLRVTGVAEAAKIEVKVGGPEAERISNIIKGRT